MSKRSYRPRGTGHVFQKGNTWYGEFYLRGRKVKRSLGPIRQPGTRIGLTRTMAEKKLREQMTETAKAPPPVLDGRWTIADVGARRIASLARKGRQPDTTLSNYEADIRLHFAPFFADTPIDRIAVEDIEEFLDDCLDAELRAERGQRRLAISTVAKLYTHLSGIFEFAIRKHWCHTNPCKEVDKPASATVEDDPEIRFLTMEELEAVLLVAAIGACKHTPKTLERAAIARELRDVAKLQWKEVGARLGCSAATAMYLYRATPGGGARGRPRARRAGAVPDRGDDRAAAGRAARAALAGHRLDGREDPGHVWHAQEAPAQDQVALLAAVGADGRPRRRRARRAVQGLRLPVRGRVWCSAIRTAASRSTARR